MKEYEELSIPRAYSAWGILPDVSFRSALTAVTVWIPRNETIEGIYLDFGTENINLVNQGIGKHELSPT